MLCIRNGSHWRIRGAAFSGRDVTNGIAASSLVRIGDAGSTTADDVSFTDATFIEGAYGDYLRLDGGAAALTVTRVAVTRTRFEHSVRAGIEVLPGTGELDITWSWFLGNANRDIYFEAPTDNVIGQATILGNTFDRTGSTTAASVTLSGNGGTTTQTKSQFKYNRVIDGVVEGANLGQTQITANAITVATARGATANVALSGSISDVSTIDNYLLRSVTADSASLIKITPTGAAISQNVIVRGNRGYQYSGTAPGIDIAGTKNAIVTENNLTYNAASVDAFVGIYCTGSTTDACSGSITRNRIKKDVLTDGTTPAGRMLAGIQLLKGSQTTIGRIVARDNVIDGALDGLASDATGATAWPDGYPIWSGNFFLNGTTEIAGGLLTYRTESTPAADLVSSGALSITSTVSFVTTAGTVANYTLGDGVTDGQVKYVKIKSATSSPAGTLTPLHMADGSSHTITWTTATVPTWFELTWDTTATTWRMLGSANVTIN